MSYGQEARGKVVQLDVLLSNDIAGSSFKGFPEKEGGRNEGILP